MTHLDHPATPGSDDCTWADGFGRWYARVPVDLEDPVSREKGRERARELIRRELEARGPVGVDYEILTETYETDRFHGTETTREHYKRQG